MKFLTLLFFLVFNFNIIYASNSNELYEKIDLFGEVLENIKDEYVDDVNQSLESTVVSSPLEPPQINQYFGYEYFEQDGNYLVPPKEKLPASLRTIFIGCFMFFSVDKN